VHPGKRLENNYSLNTVDICPVGALTSNDFRFQQRVWFLTETNSICTGCGRGCNMEIGARGDTIYRQTPRDNNDVNSTWMCDSGRLDFHFVNSEFRLTDPMIKTGGKHNIATWKAALSNIATALAGKKGEEIAIIASARMTNEELFFVKHLAAQLGTTNVDVIPRTGCDGKRDDREIGPHRERARIFVADDEPVEAKLLDFAQRLLEPFEHTLSEAVHLGAEFEARDAVAQVDEARQAVVFEHAATLGQRRQRQATGDGWNGFVATVKREILTVAEERPLHEVEQRRNIEPFRLELLPGTKLVRRDRVGAHGILSGESGFKRLDCLLKDLEGRLRTFDLGAEAVDSLPVEQRMKLSLELGDFSISVGEKSPGFMDVLDIAPDSLGLVEKSPGKLPRITRLDHVGKSLLLSR
jgi:hypothetical protein